MLPINKALTYFMEIYEIILRLYIAKEENQDQCLICSLDTVYCWFEEVDSYCYSVSVPWFNWQYMLNDKENETLYEDPNGW